jgi:hypothetical protein
VVLCLAADLFAGCGLFTGAGRSVAVGWLLRLVKCVVGRAAPYVAWTGTRSGLVSTVL